MLLSAVRAKVQSSLTFRTVNMAEQDEIIIEEDPVPVESGAPKFHWVATDNQPGPERAAAWETFARTHCSIFRAQTERGSHEHYQIYFKLKTKKRFSTLKAIVPGGVHLEPAHSPQHAWDYSGKADSRVDGGWSFSVGERPVERGHRSDLDSLREAVATGGIRAAFAHDFASSIKYARGLQVWDSISLAAYSRTAKTAVYVFVGAPGCGKSSLARAICEKEKGRLHVKLCSAKWWDHYDPRVHTDVLLDDFNGALPGSQLLAIMDRGEAWVEVKGQVIPFTAKRLYITSNIPLEDWYKKPEDGGRVDVQAIKRRVDFFWAGNFEDEGLLPVPVPRSAVILGADPRTKFLYFGDGKWEIVNE